MNKRTITILGATGSIGVQTLQVIDAIPQRFRIGYLTANSKIDLLAEQAQKYDPIGIVIGDYTSYKDFKSKYKFNGKILYGKEGLIEAASDPINDMVLSALVGFSGVEPTLSAIEAGTTIALANKETLVSAGSIITESAKKSCVQIIAVDSEHSAILQCLVGERTEEIEKIILTASGGPFLNTPIDEYENLTVSQALAHPNWSMGSKITIDSATMMNKGFEVIEAYWLFGIDASKIDILIHPQSIVHSMVQFIDGSIKAQLGLPDMRIPISYALSYPNRLAFDFPRLNLADFQNLSFSKPDYNRFPCLNLAFDALRLGGTAPAIVNAANEIAVYSFLKERIKFTDIPKCINNALQNITINKKPSIGEIISIDFDTRKITEEYIETELSN